MRLNILPYSKDLVMLECYTKKFYSRKVVRTKYLMLNYIKIAVKVLFRSVIQQKRKLAKH